MTRRRVYSPDATHTRVSLTICAWGDDGVSGRMEGLSSDLGHVVSCSTTKNFGPASGTWQVTVKKPEAMGQRSWLSLWRDPEDLYVWIQWVVDGQLIDGMLGMIDTISEATRWDIGGGSQTYTIAGRDVGKAFEQTQCFTYLYAESATQALGALANRFLPRASAAAPGHYVANIAEAWLGNFDSRSQPWRLPPGMPCRSLWALMLDRVGCQDIAIDGQGFGTSLMNADGAKPLWSLMQEYANGLMNELYVDLAPPQTAPADALAGLRPALTLRRKPFPVHGDRSAWNALLTHHIRPEHMAERSVTRGGAAQRFNFWMFSTVGSEGVAAQAILRSEGDAGLGRPGSSPIWNERSIQRHGMRLWSQESGFYVPITADPNPDAAEGDRPSWVRLAASWLHALHDWYAPAPMELSGTLTLARIYPEIRIGHRVVEGGVVYYVEGVTHAWSMGQRGSTSLTVTRGEYEGDDLLARVYAEYEQVETARAELHMPRELLQTGSADEVNMLFRDGAVAPPTTFNMRARVDVDRLLAEGSVGEGDGFTTTNDTQAGQRPTTGEGGATTQSTERQLGHIPRTSPAEHRRARAFRGEPEPARGEGRNFDQDELEIGNPIDIEDPIGGLTDSDRGAR